MTRPLLVTVVETPEFLSAARKLMDDAERESLVDYLARNPLAGALIPGTGGVRKLRWGLEGRGKRGGARVVYFYYDPRTPLFALTAYAKNERENLTQQDRNDLKGLTALLKGALLKDAHKGAQREQGSRQYTARSQRGGRIRRGKGQR